MPNENHESPSQSRTPAQIVAIKKIRRLSQIILGNYSRVAQDYQDGLTCQEIAIKNNLDRDHNVGIRIAEESVRFALKCLITDEMERKKLAHDHLRTSGFSNWKKRRGIHGQSPCERSANSALAGASNVRNKTGICGQSVEEKRALGKKTYDEKKGIFGMPIAELKAAQKKARLQNGYNIDWDSLTDPETGLTEGDYCDQLTQTPGQGVMKKMPTRSPSF
jgi:hypothetical protein